MTQFGFSRTSFPLAAASLRIPVRAEADHLCGVDATLPAKAVPVAHHYSWRIDVTVEVEAAQSAGRDAESCRLEFQ